MKCFLVVLLLLSASFQLPGQSHSGSDSDVYINDDLFIYDGCLYGCRTTASGHIDIPEGVTYIGIKAFLDCHSVESITIPETVRQIGVEAFKNCISLKSIVLPDTYVRLERRVFRDSHSLQAITLPKELETITPDLFAGCISLKSVVIPASVTAITDDAFDECHPKCSISISPDNSVYDSPDSIL